MRVSKKQSYGEDIRLNKHGKPRKWDLFKRWLVITRDKIRSSSQYIRSFIILFSLALLLISVFGGWHHKNVKQNKRAMEVSEMDKDLTFSKSGTEFKLLSQSTNKDMTVIPFKIDGSDTSSFDAKNYKVSVRQAGKMNLPKRISGSLVMFGSNGYGAVVLRGDLEKKPMQVIISNDKDFADTSDGSGVIKLDGREQEVPYNAVAFTVNPKGNNVQYKKSIGKDMSYPALYKAAVADGQILSLKRDKKKAEKDLKNAEGRKKEMQRRVKQLNKALGHEEDDYKYDSKVDDKSNDVSNNVFRDDDDDGDSYDEQIGDDPENSDLSDADMGVVRNHLISDIQSIDQDIEEQESNLKGIQSQYDDVMNTVNNMDNLTTVSNDFNISEK